MAPVAVGALVVMFFMAGHPERLHAWLLKAEAILPARIAAMIARFAQTFAEGFAVVRRPSALVAAMAWSMVLWIVDRERHLGGVDRVRHRDAVHRRVADAGAAGRRRRGADAGRRRRLSRGVSAWRDGVLRRRQRHRGRRGDRAARDLGRAGDDRGPAVHRAGRAEPGRHGEREHRAWRGGSSEVSVLRRHRRQGRRLAREPRGRRRFAAAASASTTSARSASPATSASKRSRTWW